MGYSKNVAEHEMLLFTFIAFMVHFYEHIASHLGPSNLYMKTE